MSLATLRAWVQANAADPTDATYQAGGGPTTLAEAIAAGHDGAVHEALNRRRSTLQVNRGTLATPAFMADWTPTMDAALSNAQHRWLSLNLNNGSIDLGRPAVAAVLGAPAINFPLTRDGSAAETHLGREVSLAEVAAILQRRAPALEHRKVPEADGTISMALFADGVEIERHPHPDRLAIDPALVVPGMGEREINAALRLGKARRAAAPLTWTTPTPAERAAFVLSRQVRTGVAPGGQTMFAATFIVPDGIEAQGATVEDAIDGLMRIAQREGW